MAELHPVNGSLTDDQRKSHSGLSYMYRVLKTWLIITANYLWNYLWNPFSKKILSYKSIMSSFNDKYFIVFKRNKNKYVSKRTVNNEIILLKTVYIGY